MKRLIVVTAIGALLLTGRSTMAATGSFTGSYNTNFDGLGPAGAAMPIGFRSMIIAGANTAFTAATPISAAGIASATVSGNQTLIVWNPGSAAASSSTRLFNAGSWGNSSDRGLGTDPTGVAAMVTELSLTNSTGSNLFGVIFSYDLKCLTNGSAGTEASELPGCAFLYSITGSANAADWFRVDALSLGNFSQGTTSNSGNVTITFPIALTNNGIMYFRWADDNNQPGSPDQMLAIDNISIAISTNSPPSVSLISPTNGTSVALGSNLVLSATAVDSNGSITKVEFFAGAIKLGERTNAPYDFLWTNASPLGTVSLTARATDNDNATATSATVNIAVTNSGAEKLQGIGKIFVIAMENHNFTQPNPTSSPQQIFTNPAAPYINSLITPGHSNAVQVSFAKRYYSVAIGAHPSEVNYIWSEAGTDFGVHTDNDPSPAYGNVFDAPHLTRSLNAAGIPWRNYQEDVQLSASPTNSASGTSATTINPYYGTGQYDYAVKHNPMAFFTDTQTQNVFPLTNFPGHLANNTVGRYNWITPNQFNDQHSALSGGFTYRGVAYTGDQAAIAQGDNFLSILVPQIMASPAYQSNGVIMIWWDETENGDNTNFTIPAIIISPLAKGNAYASDVELNHSSTLKTMLEIFGLSFFSNAIPVGETAAGGVGYNYISTVNDLSDLFHGTNTPPVAQDATFTRAPGLPLTIDIAALLTNSTSDADSDPRALVSVGSGTQGASVSTNATHILYNPVNDNPDDFSYSIIDGYGGNATAQIHVFVVTPGGLPQSLAVSNGVVNVQFAGIPGFIYDVQWSTNLVDWITKTNLTAPPNGLFQFIEENSTSPSFYRLMQY